ncbi:MAG: hypothetical protein HY721_31635 [Planctomycetes bacterium]|nr:hypothetical protein [Planctomycetota bacterium]
MRSQDVLSKAAAGIGAALCALAAAREAEAQKPLFFGTPVNLGELVNGGTGEVGGSLFLGGPEPPAPFPECGPGAPSGEEVDCASFPPCG